MSRRAFQTAVILAALAASLASIQVVDGEEILDTNMRTLIGDAEAMKFTHQCSRGSPGPVTGFWVPSNEELDELDRRLPEFLTKQFEIAGPRFANPRDYYRQMAGFIIGGRHIIYVNAILTPGTEWRVKAIVFCDGGTSTFGLEYDPETGNFVNLSVNGR